MGGDGALDKGSGTILEEVSIESRILRYRNGGADGFSHLAPSSCFLPLLRLPSFPVIRFREIHRIWKAAVYVCCPVKTVFGSAEHGQIAAAPMYFSGITDHKPDSQVIFHAVFFAVSVHREACYWSRSKQ